MFLKWRWKPLLCMLSLLVASVAAGSVGPAVPEQPRGYVNDFAGKLSPSEAREAEHLFSAFEQKTGVQVVAALFSSLEGDAIDSLAERVFRTWKIGSAKKDNGVLLVMALQERRLRIEVGYGLEAQIPDALARRIIADRIVPEIRRGSLLGALTGYLRGVETALGSGKSDSLDKTDLPGDIPGYLLFLVLMVIWPLFLRLLVSRSRVLDSRGARRGGWWNSGGFGGGYGGGWGGGSWGDGGGFSGGGGQSGGGGASGSW